MSDVIWKETSNLDPENGYYERQACIHDMYYIVRENDFPRTASLYFSYLEFYSDDSVLLTGGNTLDSLMRYAEQHADIVKTRENVRHDLNDEDVAYEINRSIDAYDDFIELKNSRYVEFYDSKPLTDLNRFGEPFETPEEKSSEYEYWYSSHKEQQSQRYANVRIIERACVIDDDCGGKYILVYYDVNDDTVVSGTGGFGTIEAAKKWFFGGGR